MLNRFNVMSATQDNKQKKQINETGLSWAGLARALEIRPNVLAGMRRAVDAPKEPVLEVWQDWIAKREEAPNLRDHEARRKKYAADAMKETAALKRMERMKLAAELIERGPVNEMLARLAVELRAMLGNILEVQIMTTAGYDATQLRIWGRDRLLMVCDRMQLRLDEWNTEIEARAESLRSAITDTDEDGDE
jgi:hypothetical protein